MKKQILSVALIGALSIGFSGCGGSTPKVPLTFYKTIKTQGVLHNTNSNQDHGKFIFTPTFDKSNGSFKNYIVKNNKKGMYTKDFQNYVRKNNGTFYAMHVVGAVENKIFFVGGTSTGFLSYEESLQVYNVDTKTVKRLVAEDDTIQFFRNNNEWAVKVVNKDNSIKYISMNNLNEYNKISASFNPIKIKTYYNLARGGLAKSSKDKMTVGDLYSNFNIYALYGKMPILFK